MKPTGKVKDIPVGNQYVYDLMAETGDRIIQFVWITRGLKNTSEYLDRKFTEWNFKGVKLHQCWETFSIDSDFFNAIEHKEF